MCNPSSRAETSSHRRRYQSIIQNSFLSQEETNRNNGYDDPATLPTEPNNNNNNDNDILLPLNIPLVLGPLRFLTTSQTSQSNFVPPPYLVVEIDDGVQTTLIQKGEEESRQHTLKIKQRFSSVIQIGCDNVISSQEVFTLLKGCGIFKQMQQFVTGFILFYFIIKFIVSFHCS
jgi:hypothetical protein